MVKRFILVVAIVLAVGAGIGTGYALWGGTRYVFPPPPSINEWEPSQTPRKGAVVADGSFILSVGWEYMSEQELSEWQVWDGEVEDYGEGYFYDHVSLPFNRFGIYINRFFLQKDEAVEVILRSTEPLGLLDLEQAPYPDVPLMFAIGIGATDLEEHWPDAILSNTLERVNGNWQSSFTFKAESDGYYFLMIVNAMSESVWCQYAVILKS